MNIPDGYKLVPVEPTDDMVIAFAETWYSRRQAYDDPDMLDAYRDMLTAAPAPPQPIYDEAAELSKFMDHMQDKTLYVPGFKDRDDTKMQFSDDATDTLWMGWLACAQSRAKAGEVDHE